MFLFAVVILMMFGLTVLRQKQLAKASAQATGGVFLYLIAGILSPPGLFLMVMIWNLMHHHH